MGEVGKAGKVPTAKLICLLMLTPLPALSLVPSPCSLSFAGCPINPTKQQALPTLDLGTCAEGGL